MRTGRAIVALLVLCAAAGVAEDGPAEGRTGPAIAVVSFHNGAIPQSWHWACCGRGWTAGSGVADMVAAELRRQLRGRQLQVVDSQALHRLMIDADLEQQDDLPAETALELARELDADFAVLGRVRHFEVIDFGVPFLERDDRAIARVTLDAVIIDTASGLVVAEARGLGRRASNVPPWDQGDRPPRDISSTGFKRTLLGRTLDDAMRAVSEQLRGRVRRLSREG